MKGWITAALVVTFLSGGSTGYLLHSRSAPPVRERTFTDAYLEALRREGVTRAEDLDRARSVLDERDRRILALKDKVMSLLKDQIEGINEAAEREIRAILDAAKSR